MICDVFSTSIHLCSEEKAPEDSNNIIDKYFMKLTYAEGGTPSN